MELTGRNRIMLSSLRKSKKEVTLNRVQVSDIKPERISNTLDKKIIATDKPAKYVYVKKLMNKRIVVGVILVAAIISISGSYFIFKKITHKPKTYVSNYRICTDNPTIISDAIYASAPTKNVALRKTVDKILATPNFEADQNCLYFVSLYYLNTGDWNKADKYYQSYSAMYDEQKAYVRDLNKTEYKLSKSTLDKKLEFKSLSDDLSDKRDAMFGYDKNIMDDKQ